MVEERGECDVDDILCQIEVLRRMRDLKSALGNELFIQHFPELESLEPKLVEQIQNAEGNIRGALAKCGNIDLEPELTEAAKEVSETEEQERGEAELEEA